MHKTEPPAIGDRSKLTPDQLFTLESTILPTARRWINEYPKGDSAHTLAEKTLRYWGEA